MTGPDPGTAIGDLHGFRLLAFCDHFPPTTTGGGAERVAFEVYRRLAAAGADVTVVSAVPAGDHDRPAAIAGGEALRVEQVEGRDLSRLTGAQVLLATGVTARARAALSSFAPHVMHANSLHFQTTIAAARLARRSEVPLVTTVHVAGIDRLALPVRAATGAWEQSIGRYVVGASADVVAVSGAVRDHLRSRGADPARVHVVPNGVDLDRFVPGAPDDPPVIAFVGRLIANKGPATLVAAGRDLAERGGRFRLVLVGDGPQRSELEAAVGASELLAACTTFTGYRDDVAEILATAAVLVRPSLTEGMPLAVLEAMAAGTVVVASDIPANREVVDHDRTGIIFPVGDAAALARALDRLVDDAPLRSRMAAAARSVAATRSWDETAASTASVLTAAAHRAGRWP